jgi:hypothetical protein
MFAAETDCRSDFSIVEREYVCGLARLDADRRDEILLGAIRSPLIMRSSSSAASYPVRWVSGITLVRGGVVRLQRGGSLSTPITAISSGTARVAEGLPRLLSAAQSTGQRRWHRQLSVADDGIGYL